MELAKITRGGLIGVVALAACAGPATARSAYLGVWSDNGAILRVGKLTIERHTIAVGRIATYSVLDAAQFGSGEIFQVISVNRKPDRLGCGPASRISYIIILPLPDTDGTPQKAIRALFYGGLSAPNPVTIKNDPAVCEVHAFGR